jgi:O-antigen/teichoic acid export membrane protein
MFKNVGSNWILMIVSMASAYILLPFSLRHLGIEQYGVWLLITSFTGYLSLLVLGVPMASVRFITHDASTGDHLAMNRTIATCAGMYLLIGLGSLLIGLAMVLIFNIVYVIPAGIRNSAQLAYVVVVATTSISFIAQLPHGILASHHAFVRRNVVLSVMIIVRLALTMGFLVWMPSLTALAVAQMLPVIIESAIMWVVLKRCYPEVRLDLRLFDWAKMRQIFSFSVFVLILNIGIQLSFQTDSLVIGKMLDVGQIPYYSVANTIMVYAMQFVIGIAAVVMPMATRMHTRGETEELRRLFFKWSKIVLSLSLLGCLYLIVYGPALIRVWIGEGFERESGTILQVLMFSAMVFLPIRGVALPVLMGIGKPGKATIAFLATGVLNLILSIALAHPYGLLGVAIGTAIPNVIFGVVLLVICAHELDFRVSDYLSRVVWMPVLGALPLAAVLVWSHHSFTRPHLTGILLAGFVSSVVFAVVWTFFVYRTDEDFNPRQMVGRWLSKVTA